MGENYRVEPAKSAKSSCKVCKKSIEKGELRFGTLLDGVFGDYASWNWRDLQCITAKQAQNVETKAGGYDAVGGFHELTAAQQEEFREAFEAAKAGGAKAKAKAKAKGKAKAKAGAPKAKAKGKASPKERAAGKAKAKAGAGAAAAPARPPPLKEQHEFLDAAKEHDWKTAHTLVLGQIALTRSRPAPHAKVREMLEKSPGLVNVQPSGRWSALHQAAIAGDAKAVKFLIGKGADRTLKNSYGKTAQDVAKASCKALLAPPPAAAPKRGAPPAAAPAAKRGAKR